MDPRIINHPYPEAHRSTARALIGPTGYGSFGIVWRSFPMMEERGGYSGPFATAEEATDRAHLIAEDSGYALVVENVENVNDVIRERDAEAIHEQQVREHNASLDAMEAEREDRDLERDHGSEEAERIRAVGSMGLAPNWQVGTRSAFPGE